MSSELEIRKQIDSLCNQFEEAWSASSSPEFESFLNQVDPEVRTQLLRALLEVDFELRTEAGLPIYPNDYRNLGDDAVAIVEELIKAIPSVVSNPDVYKTIVQETSTPILNTSRQIGAYKLLQPIGIFAVDSDPNS